jgi:homoserine dehydrogenase
VESDRFVEGAGVPPAVLPRTAVRKLRIALLGYGRVGQAVATLAEAERARLRAEGLRLQIVGALVRDREKPRGGPVQRLHTAADDLFAEPFDVLIDVMGGVDPAGDLVRRALASGAHVVTANKTLVAARGLEFDAFARQRGVAFVYDAAVLAGVPFLGALARRPLIGSPRTLTGIINGTSHFIACRLERGGSFAAALAEATRRGYAEPDSSADVGGRDAAEKLTILLHLAGCRDACDRCDDLWSGRGHSSRRVRRARGGRRDQTRRARLAGSGEPGRVGRPGRGGSRARLRGA